MNLEFSQMGLRFLLNLGNLARGCQDRKAVSAGESCKVGTPSFLLLKIQFGNHLGIQLWGVRNQEHENNEGIGLHRVWEETE